MIASKHILWVGCISFAMFTCVFIQDSSGEEHAEEGRSKTNNEFTVVVPLNHSSITLYDAKERKEITAPVVLRQTDRFMKPPVRYKLGKEDGSGSVCEISLPQGGVGWKLFNQGPGTNYLAWVSWADVGIKETSKPEEKPLTLRLSQFLPRENLLSSISKSAIHSDTEILYVGKDVDGLLKVKVRDPVNDRTFDFTFDGKAWRGYTSDDVELPPKWK